MDVTPIGNATFPTGTDVLLASAETPVSLDGPAEPTEAPNSPDVDATSATAASSNTSSSNGNGSAHVTPPLAKAAEQVFAPGIAVSVSYQVVHNHQEVVTVFKDAATGQVVNQVPPEILLRLAAFFDQMAGGLVDSNA
jgi:uncharacterized FlaG/YvyC family protein